MRTTIDLPDDLHRIAPGLARHGNRSLGQTVAELMRRGLAAGATRVADAAAAYALDPATGLPVMRSQQPIIDDEVRALNEEA